MKNIFLLLVITLLSFYGYAQTLDKTNKRYEAFLSEQKRNPDLKLMHTAIEVTFPKQNQQILKDKLSEQLFRKEGIIHFYFDQSKIHIFYSTLINIDTVKELLKLSDIQDFNITEKEEL